jgi:hypothetical protein
VPHCRRTRKREEFNEWICGKHWAAVPLEAKAELRWRKRQIRSMLKRVSLGREWWKLPPGSKDRLLAVERWRNVETAWARCKQAAIERAFGI